MKDSRLQMLMKEYVLTDEHFQKVYDLLTEQMDKGLKKATVKDADTKCYITFVHEIPTGKEVGKYLALDLGGTNFRVLLLYLRGKDPVELSSEVYTLSKELITGPGDKLFDYIAQCLYTFVRERNLQHDKLSIGFTFSFPCMQKSLEQATLVRWTKGFSASGVVGENVGGLLKESIKRIPDLKIGRIAILNDTTGTLMSCAHRNPHCKVGLIIGTGCNACYIEKIENTDKIEGLAAKANKHIIINIEWAALGDGGCLSFIQTDLDRIIDASSPNPGQQLYEKVISGMYLGDLVRLNLQRAIEADIMFENHKKKCDFLKILESEKDCFPAQYLSEIANDRTNDFTVVRRIFKKLFKLEKANIEDCEKLAYISHIISERAARLCGVGLSSIVNRINEKICVIAIDGSVYRFHPLFDYYMRAQMDKMVKPAIYYDLMLSEDGSGRGAALVAAVTATNLPVRRSILDY